MLTDLGHESSVVGVARIYAPIAATLVVDTVDGGESDDVERAGMRCVVTDTVMSSPERAAALASAVLAAGR
jgi:LPPG:FO 2-phospho-L-lactate transferase